MKAVVLIILLGGAFLVHARPNYKEDELVKDDDILRRIAAHLYLSTLGLIDFMRPTTPPSLPPSTTATTTTATATTQGWLTTPSPQTHSQEVQITLPYRYTIQDTSGYELISRHTTPTEAPTTTTITTTEAPTTATTEMSTEAPTTTPNTTEAPTPTIATETPTTTITMDLLTSTPDTLATTIPNAAERGLTSLTTMIYEFLLTHDGEVALEGEAEDLTILQFRYDAEEGQSSAPSASHSNTVLQSIFYTFTYLPIHLRVLLFLIIVSFNFWPYHSICLLLFFITDSFIFWPYHSIYILLFLIIISFNFWLFLPICILLFLIIIIMVHVLRKKNKTHNFCHDLDCKGVPSLDDEVWLEGKACIPDNSASCVVCAPSFRSRAGRRMV